MPEGVRWTTPGGGPSLWLEVPRSVDLRAVADDLARDQVWIDPTLAAFSGAPHLHGVRIGYAYLREDRLRRAVTLLADAIRTRCPDGRT